MRKLEILLVSAALATSLLNAQKSSAQEVTASDSQGVNLTIYNQNFGLVKDIRSMDLKPGINNVRLSDVAAQIDPTSVSLQSLTAPNSIAVREQNYQYDLIDPTTILSKSIGKKLKFRRVLDNGTVSEFTGTLLNSPRAVVADSNGLTSTRYQGLVIKTDTGVLLNPQGEIELAELPPGLISKPSLVWRLETNKPGSQKTEVAYQTQGLNWKSDYVAILNNADTQLDMTSWVTLDNKSGATYPNAALKLIAGDVHKVQPSQFYGRAAAAPRMAAFNMAPNFAEQSFAEYHLYTLQGKTDVRDNETKQLTLFNADKIPVSKLFIYDPSHSYGWGGSAVANPQQKVHVKIEVANNKKNGLGIPMPKGKVRVYKRDDDGALQFIGEDEIDHTPRDEKVRLYIGDAFDLVGERKVIKTENFGNMRRDTIEISLRNHKDSPVTITAVEHPYGDWTITSSTQSYDKKDNNTIEFPVKVAANSESKVSYTIETRW